MEELYSPPSEGFHHRRSTSAKHEQDVTPLIEGRGKRNATPYPENAFLAYYRANDKGSEEDD